MKTVLCNRKVHSNTPKTEGPVLFLALFVYAWEQRELGEVFDERTERSSNGELISVTINSGIKKFSELNRHDNSSDG